MKKFSYGFAILILAYNVLLGDFFILPYFWSKPLTSIMCILYSFILSSAVVISGSIYFYGRHGTGPNQKVFFMITIFFRKEFLDRFDPILRIFHLFLIGFCLSNKSSRFFYSWLKFRGANNIFYCRLFNNVGSKSI